MAELTAAGMKAPVWSPPAWLSPLKKLYIQVLIAIALGILLGVVYPSVAVDMKPFSDGFITLIRAVVPPIIFATVAVGIANMGNMRRVGARQRQGDRLFRGRLDDRSRGRAHCRQSVATGRRVAHPALLAR
jgi:Sodium:dicarboxylate symporter family